MQYKFFLHKEENDMNKWKVQGINLVPTDSIYKNIEDVVNSGDISEERLQKATGYKVPIQIDRKNNIIHFASF